MHGRLKIKTTAEQDAEKRKERAVKQKLYLSGLNAVFTKRKDVVHDKEALEITSQLLAANPDALTLWNYRREVLLAFKKELEEQDWQKLLEDELKNIEYCLIKNPKSYGAWHHRDWVFKEIPTPSYESELEVCDRYLQKDERNFHCWDHRRLIVCQSGKSLMEELSFTQNLIDKNFSNYSAWHYRSKLLPVIYPPAKECPHPVQEEIFLKELQKVVTAVFTDPSDQSPWFFLRWLIGRKKEEQKLLQVGLISSNGDIQLVLVFTTDVFTVADLSICINEQEISTVGFTPYNDNKCIWLLPLPCKDNELGIIIKHQDVEVEIVVKLQELPYFKWVSMNFLNENELSSRAKKTFVEIIDNCITLDQLDPGNKWVLLTLVDVMSMLSITKYLETIIGYLEQLLNLDPLRVNYYRDLKSKILWEEKLQRTSNLNCLDFEELGLSRIPSPHLLCSTENINLRNNSLKSLDSISSFLNCISLILDGNFIKDLSSLKHLRRLRKLSMNSCGIESLLMLEDLRSNDSLVYLSIENNAVIHIQNFESSVKSIIKNLKELKS